VPQMRSRPFPPDPTSQTEPRLREGIVSARPKMTESQLQASILDLCRTRRLLAFHVRDSRKSVGVGFPDLVVAGVGGVLFRELKNDVLQPTPEQMTWLGTLEAGGADAALWRPEQWYAGDIAAALARIAKPREVP
jgi:hypothetical protein